MPGALLDALRLDQEQRWRRGDRVSIEFYMQAHPGLEKDRQALAELIFSEIALREARGERPQIDDYQRRFPAFDPRLTDRGPANKTDTEPLDTEPFGTVAEKALIPSPRKPRDESPPEWATVFATELETPPIELMVVKPEGPRIPGFEIVGELGRGGMGVVYKARQVSADRFVALKVVRHDLLETLPLASRTSTLERFQHEAQAAAKLEHDNLVTVFEVGTSGDLRYYAMRFVEGRSLYDLLRDGPLDNRRAAGYLEPVCRGLHYAHQQGILHRDLKPQNVLIDERLDRPLVADFGLAKFLGGRDELTHAGDVMGTPAYMPPEQAQNAATVTAAADVYSLGATLYHVLTLRPPFQAANVGETIRQIIDVDPVPPRQLNPAIDRDLETICLKCLQKEPARRYGSAELLAEDLQRYLDGLPILARPIRWPGRTWRWCRRKPVQAGLIVTAATFAIVSLVAIIVGYRNTAAALAESELRLQQALQVVDDLFTQVSEDELLNEPGMQPLRRDLLARALKHYQYFLAESGGNPAIQDEVAAAHFRVGLITQAVGSKQAALNEFLVARRLQEKLLSQNQDDSRRLKALADTLNALGSLYKELDALDQSLAVFQQSVSLRTRLAKLVPHSQEFQRLLANTRMNLGLVEIDLKRYPAARDQLQAAQQARLQLLATDQNVKVRRDLAMGFYNLATLALQQEKQADAADHLRQAVRHLEMLITQDSRSLANRYYLAVCLRLMGGLLAEKGDMDQALARYQSARDHMESLALGNPNVTVYQTELAVLAMNLGDLYDEQENLAAALDSWQKCLQIVQRLLQRDPRSLLYRADEATALGAIGNLQLRTGNDRAAAVSLSAARSRLEALIAESPKNDLLQRQLEDTLTDLSTLESDPTVKPTAIPNERLP